MEQNRNRILPNIVIFAAVAAGIGWLGAGINRSLNLTEPNQNIGMLLWLASPLTAVLLLRAFGGDGWRDIGLRPNLRGNGGAYALSLAVYPILLLLVLAAGAMAGCIAFPRPDWSAFLSLTAGAFAANFFKNLFEEFSWRGYLTPRLQAAGASTAANHVITGAVWGAWHLPYWFLLIGPAALAQMTSLDIASFVLLSLLALFPAAFLYGELRRRTGSIWPAMLIHTTANALTLTLLTGGFVALRPEWEFFFIPAVGGLLVTILTAALAYPVFRRGFFFLRT